MPIKVTSGGSASYLVPAPLVSISKTMLKNGNELNIGADYKITLNGTLLPAKGNPLVAVAASGEVTSDFSSSGWVTTQDSEDDPVDSSIDETNAATSIMSKQEKIRNVFAQNQSVDLEITGFNENTGWKCFAQVDSVSFSEEGRWAVKCDYTIELTAHVLKESINGDFLVNSTEDAFTYYVSAAEDSWNIEETEQKIVATGDFSSVKKVFNVSHNLSAVGQRVYSGGSGEFLGGLNPWQQASGYVHEVLGLGFDNFPSGYLDPVNNCVYSSYNYVLTESIDKNAGSYGVTETWTVLPSGQTAIEDFSYSVEGDQGALTRVSARGTITGLNSSGVLSCFNDAYTNAETYYNNNVANTGLYHRVKEISGQTCLSSNPVSTSVGHNPTAGQITFENVYDTMPSPTISGALTENIQVTNTYPGQLVSVVPVIGRSAPVLQFVNSRSERKRSVQVDVVMALSGCVVREPTDAEMTLIFDNYNPANDANVKVEKVFYMAPTTTFNPRTGQFSWNQEWIYETSG